MKITALFTLITLVLLVLGGCCKKDEMTSPSEPEEPTNGETDVVFERTFGGSSRDYVQSVQQTPDGGYIIAGSTYSFSLNAQADAWLIKTDTNGNQLWDKLFGGWRDDTFYSIQQTADEGYIIAGMTSSYNTKQNFDAWLVKTDADGNQVWYKIFGGDDRDWARSVHLTTDGGYIVVGETYSYGAGIQDAWLIKTDAGGNRVWDKTFGGEGWHYAPSVLQTVDGDYVIAGSTQDSIAVSPDAWLIKTDADGNLIWDKTFGGGGHDRFNSIMQTADGGYIIAGNTESYGAGEWWDAWLIKTDADGNQVWDKTFGGVQSDGARSVQLTADGGYIIAGRTESYGAGGSDAWLIKTDAGGNRIWDKTFGGESWDYATSALQTVDGSYIMAGVTHSSGAGEEDAWLIKIDTSGYLASK